MRRWKIAFLATVTLVACTLPWTKAKATICYPPAPVVSPGYAEAGTVVTVASGGFDVRVGGVSCGPLQRLGSYLIQLRTQGEVDRDAEGSGNNRLGMVRIAAPNMGFWAKLTIPSRMAPGTYYVGYARAPDDRHHFHCPEGASCTSPPQIGSQQLLVLPSRTSPSARCYALYQYTGSALMVTIVNARGATSAMVTAGLPTRASSVIADGLVADGTGSVKFTFPLDTAPAIVTVRLNRGAVGEDCMVRRAA
jgi:hypothetical protein